MYTKSTKANETLSNYRHQPPTVFSPSAHVEVSCMHDGQLAASVLAGHMVL